MSVQPLLDAAGRRRSPATTPGFRAGLAPLNKGQRYPADPPTVDEIVAVMRQAGHDRHGHRLNALIVVLWRAGLRINEGLSLTETDLDQRRGSILVRHGKNDRRREVGMDAWAWSTYPNLGVMPTSVGDSLLAQEARRNKVGIIRPRLNSRATAGPFRALTRHRRIGSARRSPALRLGPRFAALFAQSPARSLDARIFRSNGFRSTLPCGLASTLSDYADTSHRKCRRLQRLLSRGRHNPEVGIGGLIPTSE